MSALPARFPILAMPIALAGRRQRFVAFRIEGGRTSVAQPINLSRWGEQLEIPQAAFHHATSVSKYCHSVTQARTRTRVEA